VRRAHAKLIRDFFVNELQRTATVFVNHAASRHKDRKACHTLHAALATLLSVSAYCFDAFVTISGAIIFIGLYLFYFNHLHACFVYCIQRLHLAFVKFIWIYWIEVDVC
jgi:hypothetical protein